MSLLNRITEARSPFSRSDKEVSKVIKDLRASLEMLEGDFRQASKDDDAEDALSGKNDALRGMIIELDDASRQLDTINRFLRF